MSDESEELRHIRIAIEKLEHRNNSGCAPIATGFLFGLGLLLVLACFHHCGGSLGP